MDRARVILADDHSEFRTRTAALLETDFEVVDAVGDGQALIEAAEMHDPDIVVVDITMPGLNGLDAARHLKLAKVKAKVVFLTVHQDEDFVNTALALGAEGYVVKSRLATDLVPALRQVLAGGHFMSTT